MSKVNIRFNAAICKVEGLNKDIVEAIKYRLKVDLTEERYQDYKNKTKLPLTKESGNYYLLEEFDKHIQLSTGLLLKVIKYLKAIKVEFTLHKQIEATLLDPKPYSPTLRQDQIECVDKYLKHKRGILKAYTRFGKTYCLANFINQFADTVNRLIVVPGVSPMYQMRSDLSKVLNIPLDSIGIIGDSKFDIQPITVAIPDTLSSRLLNLDSKISSYLQSVKVACYDECLDGDSLIFTNKGLVKIKDKDIVNTEVLSFNTETKTWEFKKVIKHIPKGKKETVLLKTSVGDLRCTKDHLVLTTTGWKQVKDLKKSDAILSI